LGIFWDLKWIMLVYFMVNCNILRFFGIFYSNLVYIVVILVYFLPFWYIHCIKKNLATLL
jgi:hypothetical protein